MLLVQLWLGCKYLGKVRVCNSDVKYLKSYHIDKVLYVYHIIHHHFYEYGINDTCICIYTYHHHHNYICIYLCIYISIYHHHHLFCICITPQLHDNINFACWHKNVNDVFSYLQKSWVKNEQKLNVQCSSTRIRDERTSHAHSISCNGSTLSPR